jgi:penicillin amidase
MEFWRRIGSGRLSEILGESALEDDRFIRTLGWRRVAEAEVALLDGSSRAGLEAYAQGVNAYLAERKRRLGLEFTVLRLNGVSYNPEPWTPVDTLTWGKVMAWDLGGNMDSELDRLKLQALVGDEMLADYWPEYPEDRPLIVPSAAGLDTTGVEWLAQLQEKVTRGLALGSGPDLGSNNWVVSGERTVTGMPILANDPHLGIQMPSIWYEVGLHCERCPYEVVGFSFAGMPGVIIGHNARIAWGVTNVGPDVQDLYIEKVDPDDPDRYQYKGQWLDMEVRYETIRVAGRDEPVVIKVRSTRHGPIINDIVGGPGRSWSYGWQPLALRWTALEPGTLARSVFGINQARNWQEFRIALESWSVPSQNFVYADVDGNIGYQCPGQIPIRAKGDGNLPVPGWTGEYEWIGTIPFEELPTQFNPAEGYIVTANNAVVGPEYPYHISSDWDPGYRAQRITDMLGSAGLLSVEEMGRIQMDGVSGSAVEVLPYLLALQPEDDDAKEALAALAGWDGTMRADSQPAAIYAAFWVALMDNLFADELGQQPAGNWEQIVVRYLLDDPQNPWWDNQSTPGEIEMRDRVLEQALTDGVDWLKDELGGRMRNWRFGQFHTATFENQSLGQSGIAIIERIFNRGPVEPGGSSSTVNNTGWHTREPAVVHIVPSMRQVIDLSNWDQSVAVHTTGQSGHPYHTHYDDMIPMWRDGLFHPMHWTRAQVEADAEGTLRLVP